MIFLDDLVSKYNEFFLKFVDRWESSMLTCKMYSTFLNFCAPFVELFEYITFKKSLNLKVDITSLQN